MSTAKLIKNIGPPVKQSSSPGKDESANLSLNFNFNFNHLS